MAAFCSFPQPVDGEQGELHRFRGEVYDCFTGRADALFDLLDGICTPVTVGGVAHVSLAVGARRGHGAGYAALSVGGVDAGMLRDVLAVARPAGWLPDFAVDASVWARCDAECSPGRGFYYHPSRSSAGQPIVAGWCYSWLVALSGGADSWTAPLDARRVIVGENPNLVAVEQIRALQPRLGLLSVAGLFAFDGGYDPVQLSVELAGAGVQIVVRVRNDRVFFGRPAARQPGQRGAGRRHGARFACADRDTWPAPQVSLDADDEVYGRVEVSAWHRLHPRQRTYQEAGTKMRIVEGTLIRLRVSRLPGRREREPKTLWLWWHGDDESDLDLNRVWRAYIRRFDIEHTFRFAKQALGWTTPKLRTPEQADRWTWLILAALTQLRLARPMVADHRLPWQRPQPVSAMTPGRVRQGFGHLLPQIGTPANWPKHTRPGPGRPKGSRSTPAPRYPAIRKSQVKTPKRRNQR
ncbi:NF041680 family putative transposase [Actinoplanes sp. NPDC026623]|uniref:NF041680 family putative transposase n=1 Tax=Actinoplanes sp. NPDC026623 TaxID=3155610 RepID=UPI0033D6286C